MINEKVPSRFSDLGLFEQTSINGSNFLGKVPHHTDNNYCFCESHKMSKFIYVKILRFSQ